MPVGDGGIKLIAKASMYPICYVAPRLSTINFLKPSDGLRIDLSPVGKRW